MMVAIIGYAGGRATPACRTDRWDCDRVVAVLGKAAAKAIPGAKLITYPRVGHLPQIEIPQRSADDVAAFLETQPAQP